MRFRLSKCPTCDKPPIGIIDHLPMTSPIADAGGSGDFEFHGSGIIHWDQEAPPGKKPTLTCGTHTWESAVVEIQAATS